MARHRRLVTAGAAAVLASAFGIVWAAPAGAAPGSIAFSAAALAVDEDLPRAAVLERTGGADGAVSVHVTSADGTALAGPITEGGDYTAIDTVVSWAAGDTAPKTVDLGSLTDCEAEEPEDFTLQLSDVTGGAVLGTPSTLTVTVSDAPAVLQLGNSFTFVEGGGALAPDGTVVPYIGFVIARWRGCAGDVTVDWSIVGGTATPGVDFANTTGTVSWPAFQSGDRFVTFSANEDGVVEGTETFEVELSNPTGGVIGERSRVTYNIVDAPVAPPPEPVPGAPTFTG